MSLGNTTCEKSSKTDQECLELMVTRLHNLHASLTPDYWKESFLRDCLLNAIYNGEACRLSYHQPSDTVQGVI